MLARFDTKVLRAAKDCDASLSDDKQQPAGKENWTRSVQVTMAGPKYISYVARDDYFCGGPYPDAGLFALVFDLQTGNLVDWLKLISSATIQTQTNADGSETQTVTSATLAGVYRAKVLPSLDKDCSDAIQSEDFASGFSIWPEAKAGTLVLHPNLSHALAACGADAALDLEEQRRVGLAEEMVAAIQAGHRARAGGRSSSRS